MAGWTISILPRHPPTVLPSHHSQSSNTHPTCSLMSHCFNPVGWSNLGRCSLQNLFYTTLSHPYSFLPYFTYSSRSHPSPFPFLSFLYCFFYLALHISLFLLPCFLAFLFIFVFLLTLSAGEVFTVRYGTSISNLRHVPLLFRDNLSKSGAKPAETQIMKTRGS